MPRQPKNKLNRTTATGSLAASVLALILALGSLPAQGQETPAPKGEFGEDIQVTEVLLDVRVNDKQGNVIIGLQPEDFVVREGGEVVAVETATFYSNLQLAPGADGSALSAEAVDAVPRDRYFILFLHDQRRTHSDDRGVLSRQIEAIQKSKEWVRTGLLPGDWVAVATYDHRLKVQSDFTQDRGQILGALDWAVKGKDSGNWPSRVDETAPKSLRAHLPQGKELRDQTTRIYDALEVLAEASGSISGRKNLMLFTLGFGRVDSFGLYREETRFYQPMVQALNDNNVAVYTIDLSPPGVRHTMEDAMNQLANETGGEYLFNFTNFILPLERISEANAGYYLLSYQSRHKTGESGYQRVKVDTKDPTFRVQARDGYLYGPSAEESRADAGS